MTIRVLGKSQHLTPANSGNNTFEGRDCCAIGLLVCEAYLGVSESPHAGAQGCTINHVARSHANRNHRDLCLTMASLHQVTINPAATVHIGSFSVVWVLCCCALRFIFWCDEFRLICQRDRW
jgi:hypothetical protein